MNFYETILSQMILQMVLTYFSNYVGTLHVPPLVLHLFFASQFLALENKFGCICPIVISEVTYHLVACTLAI